MFAAIGGAITTAQRCISVRRVSPSSRHEYNARITSITANYILTCKISCFTSNEYKAGRNRYRPPPLLQHPESSFAANQRHHLTTSAFNQSHRRGPSVICTRRRPYLDHEANLRTERTFASVATQLQSASSKPSHCGSLPILTHSTATTVTATNAAASGRHRARPAV